MAFADPQSVTINAVANSLPRTSSGQNSGEFRKDDSSLFLSIRHALGKRNRRSIKLTDNKVAIDPLTPTSNVPYSMSVSLVVDVPPVGYTVAQQKLVIDGFIASLTASSGANITKLLGGES